MNFFLRSFLADQEFFLIKVMLTTAVEKTIIFGKEDEITKAVHENDSLPLRGKGYWQLVAPQRENDTNDR